MHMLLVKLTIPNYPIIKCKPSRQTTRRLSLIHGMVTTPFPWKRQIDITQHLSLRGVVIGTVPYLKDTFRPVIATPKDSTRSYRKSPTRLKLLMTLYSGQKHSKRTFSKPVNGWTPADAMVSLKIHRKFKFGADIVEFARFEITTANVQPSQTLVRAITDFPTPQNFRHSFGVWIGKPSELRVQHG